MFDRTQPIYSKPDGSFVIDRGNAALDHLEKNDAEINYPGLWEEVMTFIKKNPDSVKPEPEPVFPDPPLEPSPNYHEIMRGFLDTLSTR